MAGIGHNQGPTLEGGHGWRRHCWRAARQALLPNLPIEVLRLRVRRAAEIGLDYRAYASIRASSGHDVIAFLFSSNALHLHPGASALPADRQERLGRLQAAGRGVLVQAPLSTEDMARIVAFNGDRGWELSAPAPRPFASWAEARQQIRSAIRTARWPADGVVLVGDTGFERDWAEAARLAHYLPAERFFAA
ncbi:MAG: hypothetical protein ACK4LQ_03340 [Pararhodobacter sp.]